MKRCNFDNQHQRMHERGIPMPVTTLQKQDDSMKGVIFIILGGVLVMCLALATGLLRP